jgi:phosphopantothenoylcysteine decarboxylase/phosphopantothenate--cysteine ligase
MLGGRGDLAGRRVAVSAGGTREPIDPVRHLSNRSSGKQGHALATAALRRGAEVTLVTTVESPVPAHPRLNVVRVNTAAELEAAMSVESDKADVLVMAAAVADYRPINVATQKLTKEHGVPEIILEQTPDILCGLVARRRPGQVIVGFAAETEEPLARARRKREAKGVDLMVVNDVSAPGVGFDHDTNAVTIVGEREDRDVPLTSKFAVADAVLDEVVELLRAIEGRDGAPRAEED